MRNRRKQADIDDDGRVIAPMNVEGMPWYSPDRDAGCFGGQGGAGGAAGNPGSGESSGNPNAGASPAYPFGETQKLTRRENLAFTAGVLKAVLLTAAVFLGALFAFILFCTEVWFA